MSKPGRDESFEVWWRMHGHKLALPSNAAHVRQAAKLAWIASWNTRDRRGPHPKDAIEHVLVGDQWVKATPSGVKVSRVVQSLRVDSGGGTEVWISEHRWAKPGADPAMTLLNISMRAHRRWVKAAKLTARGSL